MDVVTLQSLIHVTYSNIQNMGKNVCSFHLCKVNSEDNRAIRIKSMDLKRFPEELKSKVCGKTFFLLHLSQSPLFVRITGALEGFSVPQQTPSGPYGPWERPTELNRNCQKPTNDALVT